MMENKPVDELEAKVFFQVASLLIAVTEGREMKELTDLILKLQDSITNLSDFARNCSKIQ